MYKKKARITLSLIGILSLLFLYASSQLKFDYNFENFFPTGDEDLEFFLDYRQNFENDNDYLLIAVLNKEGIFRNDFLKKVDSITKQLEALELIQEVVSITNLKNPVIGPLGVLQPPVLRVNEPQYYEKDSSRIYENETLAGTFVAQDIPAVSILLRHKQVISKQEANLLMDQISQIVGNYTFDNVHIAGRIKAQAVYVQKMQQELLIFVTASMVLVIFFLIVIYRSWWGVVVPIIVVLLAALWISGIMSLSGKMLDVMMILLPTIIFVVGMSDVVHVLTKYLEELRHGHNKIKAIKITFREVGLATFLTSFTTAVGFLTLLTASVKPIRDFGVYTAIGVFVAFILAFTFLPALLILMKKPEVAEQQPRHLRWEKFLRSVFLWVLRYRLWVLTASLLVTGISVYGISRLQINTFLLEDIRDSDPLKKDFLFFDEHFGGSKPFEMAIIVQDSARTVYDREILTEISKMESFLSREYGVNHIVSPLLVVKGVHKALNGGIHEYFKVPENEKTLNRIKTLIERTAAARAIPLTAQKNRLGRINGKMADIGSRLSYQKNQELEKFIREEINPNLVAFRLTGTSLLVDKNAQYIIHNMLQGLAIAFFVIACIAGVLFGSFRMVFITLIPNLLPLLIIAGLMGIFGIYLKLSTSIIFTIAFGIAVDDTIHFISKLRIELNKGKSLLMAVKNTFLFTGKAIIVTSVILSGGFLTLILSSFGGTFYTGLLVSLTLIFALIADLTLLPVLILLFFPKSRMGSI